ncbi:putative F-box/LRR-repeat protein [Cardamine amara subsp. amara]|uniref:F-box/LRR-repeat protein n=1 Tax=Cardamine amara subsp. amara TaxID=228776 RepID=A0ABD1AKQ8_CARAN
MSSKRMNLSVQPDILSSLPNLVLVMIISSLSFKECLRTSVLSKRWRHLCYETRNIVFKKSEYVDRSVSDQKSERALFVNYMRQWVSRFQGGYIESFEIYFGYPLGFEAEIESLIEFAVLKQVKNLVLDFSAPHWRTASNALPFNISFVELPLCVYSLTTLESLKIYSCGFDLSKFMNSRLPRKLSIGWNKLANVESFLSNSPTLESLSIKFCWGVDIKKIAGDMREFVFENCKFSSDDKNCSFDLPVVETFKYSGPVLSFSSKRINMAIKDVYLDFMDENGYDEPDQRTKVEAEVISGFLNSLRGARTLTVCPYLLQVIQEYENPFSLDRLMETQHLVLRTKLNVVEFKGIRLFLNNCPKLETLTFDYLGRNIFSHCVTYCGINRRTYWQQKRAYKYLPNTLKVVVFRNFTGGKNELYILNFLIGSGRGRRPGPVLERVELYLKNDIHEKMVALSQAKILQSTSGDVQVLVYNT